MDILRISRHLIANRSRVRMALPHPALDDIEQAITASERSHTGQIRFVVEGALDRAPLFFGMSPRERAIDVFSALRVWDTEQNNGVLIYVLLADRMVEIVADRGIDRLVGANAWEQICLQMDAAFAAQHFRDGAVSGIEAVSEHMLRHFPRHAASPNELPDHPVVI